MDTIDQTEDEILTADISDEALEAAAGTPEMRTMGPGSCWVEGGRIC